MGDPRISKVRIYMFDILDEMLGTKKYQINANFLDKDIESYSLDKMPVESSIEKWITGERICRDVHLFRSRKAYGADVLDNLASIGFFEEFEQIIYENNKNKIFPQIGDIESIECLNCGALNVADTQTAEFAVQIQITYRG